MQKVAYCLLTVGQPMLTINPLQIASQQLGPWPDYAIKLATIPELIIANSNALATGHKLNTVFNTCIYNADELYLK